LRPNHAFHFGHSLGRIGNKADDQGHGSHVELAIDEWQRLRFAGSKRRPLSRRSIASIRNLVLSRIDGSDV
jgi:hypothetical protein